MNTSIFILKINKEPTEKIFKNKIKYLELETSFACCIEKKIYTETIFLILWSNLINNKIINSYKKDNFIIVEGFLSLKSKKDKSIFEKKIEITVLNIYPFTF